MKKLAMLLVLALIFSCACAEQTFLRNAENVRWITGSNLLYARGENGYFITDLEGNALSGDVYSSSFTHKDGLISAFRLEGDEINCEGVLDTNGKELVPFEYGAIDMYAGQWVVGVKLLPATLDHYDYSSWFSDNVYLIDTVDVYNLNTGAKMSLPRANYSGANAYEATINIEDRATGKVTSYDANLNSLGEVNSIYTSELDPDLPVSFYENGQYGLKKGDTVMIEPYYDSLYSYTYGYAKVQEDGKWGLLDKNGVEILPTQYDDFLTSFYLPVTEGETGYSSGGYFAVVVNGKLGYATAAGITCEPKYAENIMENKGASALFTDMEGNFNILAADGIETTVTGYDDVRCPYFSGGFFYVVRDADYNYGLIDWHGNVIFPCQYESIELSGDGRYALVETEYTKFELYELNLAQAAAPAAMETAAEPAAEAPETNVQADSPAATVLASAKLLLASDSAAALALIDSAIALTADNAAVSGMLQGARALVETDAAGNAAAINLLIDNAIALL